MGNLCTLPQMNINRNFDTTDRMAQCLYGLYIKTWRVKKNDSSSGELISQNKLELEDLAPHAYLKHLLIGYEEKFEVSHVFIDEAQDLSIFQFYTLRTILKTDMLTIFGDLAQGIHSCHGIKSWDQVKQDVFPDLDCNYLTLEQSYRTTIEIMDYANKVNKLVGINVIFTWR